MKNTVARQKITSAGQAKRLAREQIKLAIQLAALPIAGLVRAIIGTILAWQSIRGLFKSGTLLKFEIVAGHDSKGKFVLSILPSVKMADYNDLGLDADVFKIAELTPEERTMFVPLTLKEFKPEGFEVVYDADGKPTGEPSKVDIIVANLAAEGFTGDVVISTNSPTDHREGARAVGLAAARTYESTAAVRTVTSTMANAAAGKTGTEAVAALKKIGAVAQA